MNKYDVVVIIVVLLLAIGSLFVINITLPKDNLTAVVKYDGNQILEINMNINNIYDVKGYLGNVKIEVKDKKIRVIEEISPYNICSKMGFVDSVSKPIVCLPNKITIELKQSKKEYDIVI